MLKQALRWSPLIFFFVLIFFLWRGLSLNPQELPLSQAGQIIPQFELPLLSGDGLLKSQQLRGEYTVLNIWASWCEACSEEQGFLMRLAQTGIHLVGVNYKDKPQAARTWLKTWGNPYQAVGVDATGHAAMELGVYGTPETFLIGPDGRLLLRYAGVLTPKIWKTQFEPAISQQPRFEALLKELRCLVCQNQDLLESHAPLASDLKNKVHDLMLSGQTDQEIRQYLIKRYGEFVLFKPLVKPTTWLLWFGPAVLLLFGILGLGVWVWRSQKHD
ncbi:MAG: DsbE family thiol:disulfide interchange protein [Gammaproteobacteria bacterium]|nr:DsbE family thiol:disulfide interchange protein [Gammaproteobacteria bacterium]